eukprot:359757-Ditylum_brightwellii.AAC.2
MTQDKSQTRVILLCNEASMASGLNTITTPCEPSLLCSAGNSLWQIKVCPSDWRESSPVNHVLVSWPRKCYTHGGCGR